MTAKQFAAAIAKLGCSTRDQASTVLGIGRSSMFNSLAGTQPVPLVVERPITLLLKHGVPKEWQA
jgi:hypothetical protein